MATVRQLLDIVEIFELIVDGEISEDTLRRYARDEDEMTVAEIEEYFEVEPHEFETETMLVNNLNTWIEDFNIVVKSDTSWRYADGREARTRDTVTQYNLGYTGVITNIWQPTPTSGIWTMVRWYKWNPSAETPITAIEPLSTLIRVDESQPWHPFDDSFRNNQGS
ncbi:MAG TPA: hypothetical protein VH681_14505 [Nitrospiraceae bacterium]|jgi:hypothetical protein